MDEQTKRREQAAVLTLAAHAAGQWHLISHLLDESTTATGACFGNLSRVEMRELLSAALDGKPITTDEIDRNEALIEKVVSRGDKLVTVLDDDYPSNLRLVYDRPPFLFVRGQLVPEDDARAIAVVGTRSASPEGVEQADRLARGLAERGVTVISGLAKGIDTTAHRGALAVDGRTLAVMGTGIEKVYPAENAELAEQIVASGGALVSQFWPDNPPTRYRFPMRNRTMSGLALGTVVVEASHTSGARMQARIALEHGKRVFLVRDLVTREAWTRSRTFLGHPGVTIVDDVGDVLDVIEQLPQPDSQLTIA
jgi:DNA processing protein